jgi:hypothetical protein
MKRFDHYFFYFLTLGLIYFVFSGVPKFHHSAANARTDVFHPTAQQKTAHMITMLDEDGFRLGVCTATAVGPHAFLTAEHCSENGKAKMVTFDLATEKHRIYAASFDNRDHMLILVGGTAFTNYLPITQGVPKLGETVTIYGDGRMEYPPIPKYGKIFDCGDFSDIDNAAGETCYSLHVIPGDSGSAVYNTKGEIVGLVTYQTTEDDGTIAGRGFTLHFKQATIDEARTFSGNPNDLIKF